MGKKRGKYKKKKLLTAFFSLYSSELKYQECTANTHFSESELQMVGARNEEMEGKAAVPQPQQPGILWFSSASPRTWARSPSPACARGQLQSLLLPLPHLWFCTSTSATGLRCSEVQPWAVPPSAPIHTMLFFPDFWTFYWYFKTTQTFVWENSAFKFDCRESFLFL